MKIKTSELTGIALDWAVANCEGIGWWAAEDPSDGLFLDYERMQRYTPSTDWAQGGPIIELEGIAVHPCPTWTARYGLNQGGRHFQHTGPTPLIAAMRCYVASKLGDEVEIPEELL